MVLYPWTDFNGERAAISDFNESHPDRKISPVHGLRYWLPGSDSKQLWPEKILLAELFDHPLYNTPESVSDLINLPGDAFAATWTRRTNGHHPGHVKTPYRCGVTILRLAIGALGVGAR